MNVELYLKTVKLTYDILSQMPSRKRLFPKNISLKGNTLFCGHKSLFLGQAVIEIVVMENCGEGDFGIYRCGAERESLRASLA